MTLSQALTTLPRNWSKQLIKTIADLKLAIILLLAIAIVSITGTVIEQGESLAFYQRNYPDDPALFGFLTAKVILQLGLDHVYSTWWFIALLLLFGSSLTACTFNRQIPALKAARNWQFYQKPRQFQKLALSVELDKGSLDSLLPLLQQQGYLIFQAENALYARKGIIGRIGPIIVHIGILIVLLGGIFGAFTGFLAQEMIPSGETFQVNNIFAAGRFANNSIPKDWQVKVNRFWIDYTSGGEIDQFYSDLSVVDNQGEELKRETIYVNKPLRYDGVTFYQTNWSISGVKVQLNNSPIFQLPMATLNTDNQGRLWGTWIPTKPDLSEGVSLITKDLQGTMLVYGVDGQLIGAIRPGMSMEINGVNLKVLELIGATGLQIKADPGVPIVYTGFALLMAGVVMSYFSHAQIWALQQGDYFYLGGRTNRALVKFAQDFEDLVQKL
ncbi:MAG: cytochrome c biogenesis protein [Gloeocapsa sp. DLM2.Bin57]|nr:MAG: cytochrome c biogenesis protein [Gloeocapsa sp. DLM2.Bin57]